MSSNSGNNFGNKPVNNSVSTTDHEAFIKTPKQLITVVVLSFVAPVLAIIFLTQVAVGGLKQAGANADLTPAAIKARIQPVASVKVFDANAPRTFQTGEQVFKANCTTCHGAGLLNAPKVGDAGAWGKLIGQGLPALVSSATKGVRQMPAKGGNADLDEVEIARAIVHMANQSGGKWTEPAAAAAPVSTPGAQAATK